MAPSQTPAAPAIRSRRHPLIRSLRELARDAAARERQGAYLADGIRLVDEALRRQAPVELVVLSPRLERTPRGRALARVLADRGGEVARVRDDVLAAVVGAPRHQGVVARVRRREARLGSLVDGSRSPLLVIADGVQDPGNLGGLLRVAAAAGASGLLALAGCADPWGPKAARASAGAIFHLPVRRHGGGGLAARLARAGYRLVAAVPRGGRRYDRLHWGRPTAVVLGAEGPGLAAETLASVDETVSIPMCREMDSLNVLAAATLLLYEAARRGPGKARRTGADAHPRRAGGESTS